MDSNGQTNYRISQLFSDVAELKTKSIAGKAKSIGFKDAYQKAKRWTEERAETTFLSYQSEMFAKVAEEQEKMNKYYSSKQRSIGKIAIENIRESKLKELEQEKEAMSVKHSRRKLLVPVLDCLQIAYVEFC